MLQITKRVSPWCASVRLHLRMLVHYLIKMRKHGICRSDQGRGQALWKLSPEHKGL